MRDIKFRSWDAEQKEFNTFDLLGQYDDHAYYLLDTDNVEQFTGLQDKNGVDIYVGDIVDDGEKQSYHVLSGKHEVKMNGGGVYPFAISGWEGTMNSEDCEIIGNIHQNPELVEK